MQGKICLVTGANAGIGMETALGLASLGATVVLLCRDEARGVEAMDEIERRSGNSSLHLLVADLASQSQIRRVADEYLQRFEQLDVLVNNAGVLGSAERKVTEDGIEMTFAVNHLAPFLLTNLLLERLKSSAPSRIITVSSISHAQWDSVIDFEDLQNERGYKPHSAYSQSKLENVYFTYEQARRLKGTGVTANCLHPGMVTTSLFRNMNLGMKFVVLLISPLFVKPDQGADTVIYLASSPEVANTTEGYFKKRKQVPSSRVSYDEDRARRLWEISESLTGLADT